MRFRVPPDALRHRGGDAVIRVSYSGQSMRSEQARLPVPSVGFFLLMLALGGVAGLGLLLLSAPFWLFYVAPVLMAPLLIRELRALETKADNPLTDPDRPFPASHAATAARGRRGLDAFSRDRAPRYRSRMAMELALGAGARLALAVLVLFGLSVIGHSVGFQWPLLSVCVLLFLLWIPRFSLELLYSLQKLRIRRHEAEEGGSTLDRESEAP